jgi:16S rRNA (guanine527-N7)-methyltransferase
MILFFCYFVIMNPEMQILRKCAQNLYLDLTEKQLTQFDIYRRELLQWNARTNLISEKSSREIIPRHFLDSLTALEMISNRKAKIIDIGCGAGFPGIPLKIAVPSLQLYLLEANRKKISFVKHIVRLLNLSHTVVLHGRAENLLKDDQWKDFFTIVISRATFKLPEILPLAAFFLKPGGLFIALKGHDLAEEFLQAAAIASCYRFGQLFQHDTDREILGTSRKIIVGKKIK